MARYKDLGLQLVEWADATSFWQAGGYEDIKLFTQVSIGNAVYDKDRKVFIVISTYCKEGGEMDGVVIPQEWLIKLTPLKQGGKNANDKSRVKGVHRRLTSREK